MRHSLILALTLLLGCELPPTHPEVLHPCDSACESWRDSGCPEGEPTPGEGITCEQLCRRTLFFEPLPLQCIAEADSCEEARRCEQ